MADNVAKRPTIGTPFKQQGLEQQLSADVLVDHSWMKYDVTLHHSHGCFTYIILDSEADVMPSSLAHSFSSMKNSHFTLSFVVELVQHMPNFILQRIEGCPHLIVIVLDTKKSLVATWATKAFSLRVQGAKTIACLSIS
jgi:hypothetical protein